MYSSMALKLSELSMASPKPGVSTTVSLNLTPRSSISTVEASNFTVCFCFSIASGMIRSGYKSVRNRLLTSVDLPKPDSPTTIKLSLSIIKINIISLPNIGSNKLALLIALKYQTNQY
uniref:Uncharacterized protein n=1 Tax=Glossina austeni TaxID=7395 RepID=A0A1A9VB10_GLOAU